MIKKLQKEIFWIVLLPPMAVLFIVFVVADVTDILYLYHDWQNALTEHEWYVYILKSISTSVCALIIAAVILRVIAKYISRRITAPVEDAITKQNRFVADASHELKTPVSVINANIAVLERNYGENKWMKYIKDEGHKMTILVNQLLNLSRLDYEVDASEHVVAQRESFDAVDALTAATLPFDSIAFEKNANINVECSGTIVVSGNRNDFKEIISILIDNAIKHVNVGGEITVATNNSRGGTSITVSNTGSTISSEDLPHIFDRFYKGSGESKYDSYNFGLGLSIAKALADKNGYVISASSENGKTHFILEVDA